jgi:hypothetical protein
MTTTTRGKSEKLAQMIETMAVLEIAALGNAHAKGMLEQLNREIVALLDSMVPPVRAVANQARTDVLVSVSDRVRERTLRVASTREAEDAIPDMRNFFSGIIRPELVVRYAAERSRFAR